MKFICTQENLFQGVSIANKLPNRSSGLPILNNILVEIKEGVLELSSTNLEIGIVTHVRGKVESEGAFTVDAKILSDYVSILPKSNVSIELDKNQLVLACDNFHTKIRGQAADDFPIIPRLIEENGCIINAQEIQHALGQTIFAASLDEMRPEITGVFFMSNGDELTIVATDSYRLAEKKIILKKQFSSDSIVHLRALQELERIISITNEEKVFGYVNENQIMFVVGSTILVSKLIEGNYPNYKQIIPSKYTTQIVINHREVVQATRAASLFARSGINDIHLHCNPTKNEVEIKTSNTQLGEQKSTLKARVTGAPESITINYKYFLDGLQAIMNNDVIIEITSDSSPVVLRSKDDTSYLYLIMPIKQ